VPDDELPRFVVKIVVKLKISALERDPLTSISSTQMVYGGL
jgi:hypothetical protein